MKKINAWYLLRALSLGAFLMFIWLINSGHYKTLTVSFGIASCVFVVLIAHRMRVIDEEGHPWHLLIRVPIYLVWLFKEIVKANIDVVLRVLRVKPISPQVSRLKMSQKTDLGKVIYANSITLTPGTVSFLVDDDQIVIHALSKDAADDLAEGVMDRKVVQVEGER